MKKLITLLLLALAIDCGAQNIALGISQMETNDYVDSNAAKSLYNRLRKMLTQAGVADYGSDFVIVPRVEITDDQLIEGGMKNIYKIEAELFLEVYQMSTNKSFGSTSVELKGSGIRKKSAAMKEAFSSIKNSNAEIIQFINNAKSSVIKYYSDNKAAILSRARAAASQNNYEEAIAILASIPEGMSYSAEVDKEMVTVFEKYRKQNCEATLMQARAAIASKQFDLALSLLSEIDPGSPCASSSKSLISSINSEIRSDEARERADMVRRENLAADLVKTRINAARDVAKAYYQRTYPTYNLIFR